MSDVKQAAELNDLFKGYRISSIVPATGPEGCVITIKATKLVGDKIKRVQASIYATDLGWWYTTPHQKKKKN